MPVPLQIQLFDAFLGTQEGIHSIILPDLFSSGGSKNVYIDKFGRVSQIGGYSKRNASEFLTNTGANRALIRGIIPYRKTSGGTIARQLLFVIDDFGNGNDEWEIWISSDNGATGSFLHDAGASSVGMVPDSAQFGDNLYITNGKMTPKKYDGASLTVAGLTRSPTPTASESSASGNLQGNYIYKLVSTKAGVRQNGSVSSTSVLVSSKQVDLSWTADADVAVDGYEIYRTTGTGTTFYYVASIDGRATVAFTDNLSDTTLLENRVLEEHGDTQPTTYFCEPHKQRMWWLRSDTYPTRGWWSDPAQPESVYGSYYLDFSDSETVGDQITGALGNFEGLLVVFTEKALWTVSGTGAIIGDITDWTKSRTNAQTGSVSHRSAVRIPGGSKYSDQNGQLQTTSESSIAYFTPLGDIRLFDGDNDLIISHPVKDTLATFNYQYRHKIYAVNDSQNSQIIWFFPTGSNGECNAAVAWSYKYGVWFSWPVMPFNSVVEVDDTADAAVLLAGQSNVTTGAYIYDFFSGNSFDGSNIETIWMTKTLYGVDEQGKPALTNRKRWRWADVLFKINQDVSITVEWLNGNSPDNAAAIASATVQPQADSLITSQAAAILTATNDAILCSASSAQTKVLMHNVTGDYLHDEGMRMRVKTNATNGQWALEALQIAYQILPGLKRRDQI